MCTGGPFPGGKVRSGRDADHSPPSSAEVKNELELYLLSPQAPPWRVAGSLYLYLFFCIVILSYKLLFLFCPVCSSCLIQSPWSLGISTITHCIQISDLRIWSKYLAIPRQASWATYLFYGSSWSYLGDFRHPYWRNYPNTGSVSKSPKVRWSKPLLAIATVRSFLQNISERNSCAFLTSHSVERLH
jgi:hypothetical protein